MLIVAIEDPVAFPQVLACKVFQREEFTYGWIQQIFINRIQR